MTRAVLSIVIPILALVDGLVHLSLDLTLFHANFTLSTLSELFLLNFLGYLVLIAAFLLSVNASTGRRTLVDVVMIAFAVVTFLAWLSKGGPNPMDFAFISKPAEFLLVVALVAHVLELRGSEAKGLAV